MLSLAIGGCVTNSAERRLLAVGGVYVFERQTLCGLVSAQPQSSVKRLEWVDALVLEALSEGVAEVVCGKERFELEIAIPARLEIKLTEGVNMKPTKITVDERFHVQVNLYDRRGRELEIGKLTKFDWVTPDILEVVNDRSSGEFGFCDTCYGMYSFHVLRPGKGSIEARLGGLWGKLQIETVP